LRISRLFLLEVSQIFVDREAFESTLAPPFLLTLRDFVIRSAQSMQIHLMIENHSFDSSRRAVGIVKRPGFDFLTARELIIKSTDLEQFAVSVLHEYNPANSHSDESPLVLGGSAKSNAQCWRRKFSVKLR
jgi:hypothetical protein